jgi:hypothetical protein
MTSRNLGDVLGPIALITLSVKFGSKREAILVPSAIIPECDDRNAKSKSVS